MRTKLNSLITLLLELGLKPRFGVELEFYIIGDIPNNFLNAISTETGIEVQNEKGNGQYELASEVFDNVFALIDYINCIKSTLLSIAISYGIEISFAPKPYSNDHGSAMHIHLSLYDVDNNNIFNKFDTIDANNILLNVIGGILALINSSLNLIIKEDENEFRRLHNSEFAPSTVSWGKNNRTTAIRIPESNPHHRNRRIEFRVPSASSDITNCIIFLLTSTLYGIKHTILPDACIYGNANDTMYNLTLLHNNVDDMRAAFSFWDIFNSIMD
jgi:glutamine synthetase